MNNGQTRTSIHTPVGRHAAEPKRSGDRPKANGSIHTSAGRHAAEGQHPRTENTSTAQLSKQHLTTPQRRQIQRTLNLTDEEANLNPTKVLPTHGNPTIQIKPLAYMPDVHTAWVYILTNRPNGTLYIGMTNNLPRRIKEHETQNVEGFSKRYNLTQLVYYEGFSLLSEAITTESKMKNWSRANKVRRILATNPNWQNLTHQLTS